jgi:hypothetical protein
MSETREEIIITFLQEQVALPHNHDCASELLVEIYHQPPFWKPIANDWMSGWLARVGKVVDVGDDCPTWCCVRRAKEALALIGAPIPQSVKQP